jgi:hypothetical protein
MVVFMVIGTDTDKYVYKTMINYITRREIKKVHSVWLKFLDIFNNILARHLLYRL